MSINKLIGRLFEVNDLRIHISTHLLHIILQPKYLENIIAFQRNV